MIKFKLKRVLPVVLTSFMLLGVSNAASAESKYKIDSLVELKQEIVELNKFKEKHPEKVEKEREKIINNTDPTVLNEYNQVLVKDLTNLYKSLEGKSFDETTTSYDLPNSEAQVTISAVDEEVQPISEPGSVSALTSLPNGSHTYTVDHAVHATLYPDSHCVLVTNYKAAATGLTLTSVSTAGTYSVFPTSIVGSAKITDSKAEQVGYDINGQGDYKVTIGGYNGIGFISFDVTIISTIKWTSKGVYNQAVSTSNTVTGDITQ